MADMLGTSGGDLLIGTAGSEKIDGLGGDDVIHGAGGNDTLTAGPGFDYLFGDAGDDILVSKRGTGPDYFDGGSGNDRLNADFAKIAQSINIDLSDSNVLQFAGDGSTIVNIEAMTVIGGSLDDRLLGGNLDDQINGYDGEDILQGRGGNDTIVGGDGYDVALFSGSLDSYVLTQQSGGAYRISGPDGTDTLLDVETLRFADGDYPVGGYSASARYWGSVNGAAVLVSASNLPDGRGATPGTGFTITGLAHAQDGSWWAANEGQADPTDSSYTPSLVHLSANERAKIGEIALPSSVRAIQGLAYKSSTHELFIASLSERLIRVYSETGNFIRSIATTAGTSVNGLAYDDLRDALIIGRENDNILVSEIEWRSLSTNLVVKTMKVSHEPDHLFFDAGSGTQGSLYYSYGDSGAGRVGYVVKIDVASGQEMGTYTLPAADAIEGLYIDGSSMWIANDAYFHAGAPPLNRILEYQIEPEALMLDVRTSNLPWTIDLTKSNQTLVDGRKLAGVDRIFFHGGSAADTAIGGVHDDILVGGDGADMLRGGARDDRLVGGAGADLLTGGPGLDGLEGNDGSDTAVLNGNRSSFSAQKLSAASVLIKDLRSGSPEGTDTVRNVEYFRFTDGTFSFEQLLAGGQPPVPQNQAPTAIVIAAQHLSQAENVNVVGGIKILDFTILDDTLGVNNASLVGTEANLFEIRSMSTVQSIFYIGPAFDFEAKVSYDFSLIIDDTTVGATPDLLRTFSFTVTDVDEGGTATIGNDRLFGTAGNDILDGLGGDDALFGLAGADSLYGRMGNDELSGGNGADLLDGGDGTDIASYGDATSAVTVNLASPGKNTGFASGDQYRSIEKMLGSNFADSLTGDGSANTLDGGRGSDVLAGGGGADYLYGGDGDDRIVGQGGNDRIWGGIGADQLTGGGGGRDWFIYDQPWGSDTILDFEDNVDLIDMRATGLAFGNLTITSQQSHTLVANPLFGSILLMGVPTSNISATDFLF